MKKLSRHSWSSSTDLYPEPPEYESEAKPLDYDVRYVRNEEWQVQMMWLRANKGCTVLRIKISGKDWKCKQYKINYLNTKRWINYLHITTWERIRRQVLQQKPKGRRKRDRPWKMWNNYNYARFIKFAWLVPKASLNHGPRVENHRYKKRCYSEELHSLICSNEWYTPLLDTSMYMKVCTAKLHCYRQPKFLVSVITSNTLQIWRCTTDRIDPRAHHGCEAFVRLVYSISSRVWKWYNAWSLGTQA